MKRILLFMIVFFLMPAIFAEASISDKNSKFLQAAKEGNISDVQAALAEGADVNEKNTSGETALLYASIIGNIDIVKLLLDKGADINAKETSGFTALMGASIKSHTEIVKLLLDKGADVNAINTGGQTALISASLLDHTEIVKLLLDKGADVNEKNTGGGTALWVASLGGHKEIVKLLLDKGAEVNAKAIGITALMGASAGGYTVIVKMLLDKGADVNIKNDRGETALTIAKRQGKKEVVEILEGAGETKKVINQKIDNPMRNKLGVLIVAGEGFNSKYKDQPQALNASAILFVASQKFAESLYSEIEKRGTKAQIYINRDVNADPMTYIPSLFVDTKRDGLIEVRLMHIKNEEENSFYLLTKYHRLEWIKDDKIESFIVKEGTEAKYKLLGKGFENNNASLTTYARDFAEFLSNAGYIGSEDMAPYQDRGRQTVLPRPTLRSL